MNDTLGILLAFALVASTADADEGPPSCRRVAAGVDAGAQMIRAATGDRSVAGNLGLVGRWNLAPCIDLPLAAELRIRWVSLGPDFGGGTNAVDVSTLAIHTGLWGVGRLSLWRGDDAAVGLHAGLGAVARTTRATIAVQGRSESSTEVRMLAAGALGPYLDLGRWQLALRLTWATPRADGPALAAEVAVGF